MIRLYAYTILMLLTAISCENKKTEVPRNTMSGMKGMDGNATEQDTVRIEKELYSVVNSVNEVVISGQATVKPVMRGLGSNIAADGYIALDERRNNKIAARFGGRIEHLYVKYNYQYVRKGEKIMELYSPAVNTIEEEYIHHLTTASDRDLVQKTREKLLLLGLLESQVASIEKSKKPLETITVYSPYEGYVLFDINDPGLNGNETGKPGGMGQGMGAVPGTNAMQTPASEIKEGGYVNEGQTMFVVNDFKEVWAIVAFDPKDEAQMKVNTPVQVRSDLGDQPAAGIINFIEPVYKDGQKFTQARIYLENKNLQFKINSIVFIKVFGNERTLSVPRSAVFDLGERKIVWVKTGDRQFQPRNVFTGSEANGFTEIISGITERDEIAKDAGYMIDSESLISTEK